MPSCSLWSLTAEAHLNLHFFVLGWGRVSGWGPLADQLKQAKLQVRSDEDCKAKYRNLYDRNVHLCAGEGRVGASGGCQGDSGGPFVCAMGDTWYLQGAVSFGMKRCTTAYYTVFTKITNHVSWLLEMIGLLLNHKAFLQISCLFNNSQTFLNRRLRVSLPSFISAELSENRSLLQQDQNVTSVGCKGRFRFFSFVSVKIRWLSDVRVRVLLKSKLMIVLFIILLNMNIA